MTINFTKTELLLVFFLLLSTMLRISDLPELRKARTENLQTNFLIAQCQASRTINIVFADGSTTYCFNEGMSIKPSSQAMRGFD